METKESKSLLDYGKPPWLFKGSALYQLHLVKAETARAFIPKEFKLVEAFGYTLGGFFLANYDESPAGAFDELVVIAGIVWNPPTSCAWAARVLVNSDKACVHGRQDVGLPSQVANFSKTVSALPATKRSRSSNLLHNFGMAESPGSPKNSMKVQVEELTDNKAMDICSINLCVPALQNDSKWIGPAIKMSLPSFSGRTEDEPHLLKYSCQIECRLRAVAPAKVSGPGERTLEHGSSEKDIATGDPSNFKRNLSISVMLSKPILALEFNCLKMTVDPPSVIPQ